MGDQPKNALPPSSKADRRCEIFLLGEVRTDELKDAELLTASQTRLFVVIELNTLTGSIK